MTGASANVLSNEAIEIFRVRLLVYLSKVKPLLEDSRDDVIRAREWVRGDRATHWRGELNRRRRKLEQAQQALFAARFSDLRETSSAELMAVERAKRAVTEAEDKLRAIKRWTLEFDHRVLPLLKHLDHLNTTFANELPKGAEYLREIVKALEAYTENIAPSSIEKTGPNAGTSAAEPVQPAEPAAEVSNREET
jgi:hypothetical protein